MSKLFQISEPDLATLERAIPELAEVALASGHKDKILEARKAKEIISRLRYSDDARVCGTVKES